MFKLEDQDNFDKTFTLIKRQIIKCEKATSC